MNLNLNSEEAEILKKALCIHKFNCYYNKEIESKINFKEFDNENC